MFKREIAEPSSSPSFEAAVSERYWADCLLVAGLERLAVWDTQFFVRIAQCGYEFEQFHAFFPLVPFLLRCISGKDRGQHAVL